jgi:hypothetical protein
VPFVAASLAKIEVYSRISVTLFNIKFHENKVRGPGSIDTKTEDADRRIFTTSCCKRGKRGTVAIGHNKQMKFNVRS